MSSPIRVGEVLATLPGMAERLAEVRLLAAWTEIAGPAAARSRAEGIEGGVLQVSVDSPGWLHRLNLDEPRLLARLHAVAPASGVRAIRFRLGPPGASRDIAEGIVIEGEPPR
jgi:predicted nucleic acid-binding Zn ribbon protein